MKILQIASYISINEDPDFKRNISGYGYMVVDIARSVAELENEVQLLTHNCFTQGKKIGRLTLLPRRWVDIGLHFKLKYIFQAISVIIREKHNFFWAIRILFYYLGMGHIEYVLKIGHYDLVHIHGITFSMIPVIQYCESHHIRFVTTLHGLNAFDESLNLTKQQVEIEKCFLQKVIKEKLPLSVVSSGIKQMILDYYKQISADYIRVITNGICCQREIALCLNLRRKYNLSADTKILLSVGNVSERKNQKQIVRAFRLLEKNYQDKLAILFLGKDTFGNFQQFIDEQSIGKQVIYCGNIPKPLISSYFCEADFTVCVSKSEGFGLPIVEGFVYGLPCLAYADLEAIGDLYSPESMYLVNSREDRVLALAIQHLVERDWDRQFIRKYALNFSLDNMARKYNSFYHSVL